MQDQDPQQVWEEYCRRKKSERLNEAAQMWDAMTHAGVESETPLALDFVCFGTDENNVEALAKQLSENYEVEIRSDEQGGCWLLKGTTRPYGITLDRDHHLEWVEFMSDVAQSYACVFSTWELEAPSVPMKFDSETFESES